MQNMIVGLVVEANTKAPYVLLTGSIPLIFLFGFGFFFLVMLLRFFISS